MENVVCEFEIATGCGLVGPKSPRENLSGRGRIRPDRRHRRPRRPPNPLSRTASGDGHAVHAGRRLTD